MPRGSPSAEIEDAASTELELLGRIRDGDEAAFSLLYDRYFQRVYNFAYLRLRHHADTEEIVQETFIAVFRSIEAYEGKSTLLSWVYGIAKNTVNNHLRRAKARDTRLERAEAELMRSRFTLASCTPEEQLSLQRSADAIQEKLASVARWQAEVFVLRHLQNLSIGEISKRMSRSNDAVRSSLYRVKRLLMETINTGEMVSESATAGRSAL